LQIQLLELFSPSGMAANQYRNSSAQCHFERSEKSGSLRIYGILTILH